MSKEEFINNIKKWVALDSQLKQQTENIKRMREIKNNLTTDICTYMDDNSLQNKRIEISDGYLKYAEKKEYSPLTYSYIESCLKKIIENEEQVEYIINYLKNNRQIKTSFDIKKRLKININILYIYK